MKRVEDEHCPKQATKRSMKVRVMTVNYASESGWHAASIDSGHDQKSTGMKLLLSDGTVFRGQSFGALRETRGEVVFNTGMAGYVEALTDPSYRGQVLVMTYPLQGNYGVPEGPFESSRIQVQGVVVHQHSARPSHHTSRRTLGAWLSSHGIPAIEGVDTRSLTRHLRKHGTIMGQLLLGDDETPASSSPRHDCPSSAESIDMSSVVELVEERDVMHYPGGELRVLVVDTGVKANIIRVLQACGATVIRVPWSHPWEAYLDRVDGLMLTNGPGDPAELEPIARVRTALQYDIPIFAICLGHQLLALAAGGETYKMKCNRLRKPC
jgi:carbamoyl-phosphate synthase small subunit